MMISGNPNAQNLFENEEISSTWIEVILPLALPTTYTYSVPQSLLPKIKIGCRVEVIFGKNKKYSGIIKSVSDNAPPFETKDILNVIDDEPVIYPQQLQLWKWLSDYYMCSEGEVMAAALPAHLKLSSETILVFNEEFGEDFSNLDDEEYLVAEALLLKKELKTSEVQQISGITHVYPLIKKLIDKRICFVWEEFT
ncbi:MAG: replication restart helicase PriA, partial [Ginsengibacter sp.]